MKDDYQLLDSGDGRKLEQFGEMILDRPCSQAVFSKQKPELWKKAKARLLREGKKSEWEVTAKVPDRWNCRIGGIGCVLKMTDFGHVGVFPEHARFWPWLKEECDGRNVLNLFAYSGCASIALAKGGAKVCHVDAAKGMIEWAKENAALNKLDDKAIRWIVDDALKFLKREERRGSKYDGIILDPPTFGRGPQGEIFKVEDQIHPLLSACKAVLSERPKFILFSSHTPGWTPKVMEELLIEYFPRAKLECGEMLLGNRVPSGSYAFGQFK